MSKRLVRQIAAEEILAPGEGIDEDLILKRTYLMLLGTIVELIVVLDLKDLYTLFATLQQPADRSVCAFVNFIHYQFEIGNADRIYWILGRLNLAEPGTRPDSTFIEALQLVLLTKKLFIGVPELEVTSSK